MMSLTSVVQKLKSCLPSVFSNYPVVSAYLFGSLAEGRATPLSDIDIALVFDQDQFLGSDRLKLELEIEDKIVLASELSSVDVRIINDAHLMFQGEVLTKGILLFCSNEEARVDFETRTRSFYFDFMPLSTLVLEKYLDHLRERVSNG